MILITKHASMPKMLRYRRCDACGDFPDKVAHIKISASFDGVSFTSLRLCENCLNELIEKLNKEQK